MNSMINTLKALKGRGDYNDFLQNSPYGSLLNLSVSEQQDELITKMSFTEDLIGNPILPALHGGTIAALSEMAAFIQLIDQLALKRIPKTMDIQIDYLRSGKAQDTFASAHVVKMGRRFANVHTKIWQDDPDKPIAKSHLHFLIVDEIKADE